VGDVNTFIEISKREHQHGGAGWEYGTCLWSPTKNRAGSDRYSLMRTPKPHDRVVHAYQAEHDSATTVFLGESRVRREVREVDEEPPSPGDWAGMAPYYRIDLVGYREYATPLSVRRFIDDYMNEIRADLLLNRPKFYPFNTHGDGLRTVQGIYLAQATSALAILIDQALGIEEANAVDRVTLEHQEFTESRRAAGERYFFARNPRLAQLAKARASFRCEVCAFSFVERYGIVGKEFLEAHHLDPLAERSELEWSTQVRTAADRVVAVCSNCHRMLHRRKPPYTLDELRGMLAACETKRL